MRLEPRFVGALPSRKGLGIPFDPIGSAFSAIRNAFAQLTAKSSFLQQAYAMTKNANWNNGRRYVQAAQVFLNRNDLQSAFVNIFSAYTVAGVDLGASGGYGPGPLNAALPSIYQRWARGVSLAYQKAAIQSFISLYGKPGAPYISGYLTPTMSTLGPGPMTTVSTVRAG